MEGTRQVETSPSYVKPQMGFVLEKMENGKHRHAGWKWRPLKTAECRPGNLKEHHENWE